MKLIKRKGSYLNAKQIKKLFKQRDMVSVIWEDSCAEGDRFWTNLQRKWLYKYTPLQIESIGFIVGVFEAQVRLCCSHGGNEIGGSFIVPIGCITSITKLGVATKGISDPWKLETD